MKRHDQLALHQSQFAAFPHYYYVSGIVFWNDILHRVITITLAQVKKFSIYSRVNIKISRYYCIRYKSLKDSLSVKEKKAVIWSSKESTMTRQSWMEMTDSQFFFKNKYIIGLSSSCYKWTWKNNRLQSQCKLKVLHLMNIFFRTEKICVLFRQSLYKINAIYLWL